ncbi:nucleoside diphosphate kinase 6-like [Oscarella lobularis]|uniref:nucleoside diphosphate kinase 6-like n=1 Tax=Oscarella lobularis TaxID=121494 RepID=UPI0033133FC2
MAVRFQRTLAILKPDLFRYPSRVEIIKDIISRENFHVIRSKVTTLSAAEAEAFYKEHRGKFFYNRLIHSMTSGQMEAMILGRVNAVEHWRLLMGPTKIYKAIINEPRSIRSRFGSTDTRNAVHGSASDLDARREINLVFPVVVVLSGAYVAPSRALQFFSSAGY